MAPELHSLPRRTPASSLMEASLAVTGSEMRRDALIRFSAVVLAVLTVATIVFGVINFQKERKFPKPVDGVRWLEKWEDDRTVLEASAVTPGGPGDNAGIKVGDHLLAINDQPMLRTADIQREQFRTGALLNATYELERHGIPVEAPKATLVDADNSLNQGERLIALIYLGFGLYVLFRRWTAPKSAHFYVFCLVSSILYSFHYTGKLNAFDSIVLWANITAWLLQPALFLHFAYTFPEKRKAVAKRPWLLAFVYLPGVILLGAWIFALLELEASESLRWNLDRLQMFYTTVYF